MAGITFEEKRESKSASAVLSPSIAAAKQQNNRKNSGHLRRDEV
jgi:hypothetical protein